MSPTSTRSKGVDGGSNEVGSSLSFHSPNQQRDSGGPGSDVEPVSTSYLRFLRSSELKRFQPSRDLVASVFGYPAVPAGLFSLAPAGANRQQQRLRALQ